MVREVEARLNAEVDTARNERVAMLEAQQAALAAINTNLTAVLIEAAAAQAKPANGQGLY